jgi:hypothetical protein
VARQDARPRCARADPRAGEGDRAPSGRRLLARGRRVARGLRLPRRAPRSPRLRRGLPDPRGERPGGRRRPGPAGARRPRRPPSAGCPLRPRPAALGGPGIGAPARPCRPRSRRRRGSVRRDDDRDPDRRREARPPGTSRGLLPGRARAGLRAPRAAAGARRARPAPRRLLVRRACPHPRRDRHPRLRLDPRGAGGSEAPPPALRRPSAGAAPSRRDPRRQPRGVHGLGPLLPLRRARSPPPRLDRGGGDDVPRRLAPGGRGRAAPARDRGARAGDGRRVPGGARRRGCRRGRRKEERLLRGPRDAPGRRARQGLSASASPGRRRTVRTR